MAENKHIKVQFSEGERGWAKDLGNGTVEIDNIPISGPYNLGDVVKCNPDGSLGAVVKQKYANRGGIRYEPPTKESYEILYKKLESGGVAVEGMIAGLASVAFNDDNIEKLMEGTGVRITIMTEENS